MLGRCSQLSAGYSAPASMQCSVNASLDFAETFGALRCGRVPWSAMSVRFG